MHEETMEKFGWIEEFFSNSLEAGEWNSPSHVIPDKFDHYFFLHWKVGIIPNFPFEEFPENNETISDTNLRIKIERKFNTFNNEDSENLYTPISIAELANKFNVPANYDILNQIKQTPGVEIMSDLTVELLEDFINKISPKNELNMFIEDLDNRYFETEIREKMTNVSAAEYIRIQEVLYFDFNTYLFPDNLDWCITTSEDLPMLFCCSRNSKEYLTDAIPVELFELNYESDLY